MYNVAKKHAANIDSNYKLDFNWSNVYDEESRISKYEERNRSVVEYFQNMPEKLLVIDLEQGINNKKIVDFLGYPSDFITKLPKLNTSKE